MQPETSRRGKTCIIRRRLGRWRTNCIIRRRLARRRIERWRTKYSIRRRLAMWQTKSQPWARSWKRTNCITMLAESLHKRGELGGNRLGGARGGRSRDDTIRLAESLRQRLRRRTILRPRRQLLQPRRRLAILGCRPRWISGAPTRAHRAQRELDKMLTAKTRLEAQVVAEHYVYYIRMHRCTMAQVGPGLDNHTNLR